jgi:hypothetical protein
MIKFLIKKYKYIIILKIKILKFKIIIKYVLFVFNQKNNLHL